MKISKQKLQRIIKEEVAREIRMRKRLWEEIPEPVDLPPLTPDQVGELLKAYNENNADRAREIIGQPDEEKLEKIATYFGYKAQDAYDKENPASRDVHSQHASMSRFAFEHAEKFIMGLYTEKQ